jgi:hypothetical protein
MCFHDQVRTKNNHARFKTSNTEMSPGWPWAFSDESYRHDQKVSSDSKRRLTDCGMSSQELRDNQID